MLKITLRDTYDETDPPTAAFTVMEARQGLHPMREVSIEVSVEQAQKIVIGLWRMLESSLGWGFAARSVMRDISGSRDDSPCPPRP